MIGALALLAACGGSSSKTADTAPGKDLDSLFSKYYEDRSRLFPLEATSNGDLRYNDLLPADFTASYRDTLSSFYNANLNAIKTIDREKLNNSQKTYYDVFKREMEMSLEGLTYNDNMIPFQQFWGLPLTMGQLGSGEGNQPFNTVKDYDNWLKRMALFTNWSDSAVVYFKKGMAAGYVLPKTLIVKMIPQMEALVTTDATKSLFYGPVTKLPAAFSDSDKVRLTAAYKTAILTSIVPAYKKLAGFLKDEYLAKGTATSGIGALPGGDKYYNFMIRYWTTTSKTPDEIYNTGLAEVKRIRGLMDSTKNAVGFRGDLNAFFEFMRTDKQFMPFKTPEDVLNGFRAIQSKIDPKLKTMFGKVPETRFEIRQTEAFRAASASAEYVQANADGTRPGIFYVPILDAKTYNVTGGFESLFLHEAIPGHHYQISLQQENTSLPKFMRFNWYGAYGEGWALYCESLGKELGCYTDPYQYMGALGDEMHRAVRLVVDVAIHTKNMSREEAIKYMMDNEAISEAGATAEIERYMAIPGQALSYKSGALKIAALRDKYSKQLGAAFKLAAFHDALLAEGCMPLDVLETKMDNWAKAQ